MFIIFLRFWKGLCKPTALGTAALLVVHIVVDFLAFVECAILLTRWD